MRREEERFAREHPRSCELAAEARRRLLAGVPMHWMAKWPGGFPVFVAEARGSRFTDVDGLEYVDFCLGDTGAMSGHAPAPTLRAVAEQSARGITTMLPTDDALWVAEELSRRFGVVSWQFALTATDAIDPGRRLRLHGRAGGRDRGLHRARGRRRVGGVEGRSPRTRSRSPR
jgi:glutamate-1-semialdehyde 2,1-aminomutase